MAESFTLICDGESRNASVNLDGGRVGLAPDALRDTLGWELKPEGLCRGEVCVPVRDAKSIRRGDDLDLQGVADALGQPLALDVEERMAALGTAASERSTQLASLDAPDFKLPDLEGKLHSLSDHRGKKVLLIAYASW